MEDLMYCDKCGCSMEWLDKCEHCGNVYCEHCGVQGISCCNDCKDIDDDEEI